MSQQRGPEPGRRRSDYRPSGRVILVLAATMFIVLIGLAATIKGQRNDIDDMRDTIARGGEVLGHLEDSQAAIVDNQNASRERSYAQRSVNCTNTILDNDRDFDLTAACTDPAIQAYYPPSLCSKYFPDSADCGSKSDEPGI